MPAERERLWRLFQKRASLGIPPGAVYLPWQVATSGHSDQVVRLAQRYTRLISALDGRLDDPLHVRELFESYGVAFPPKATVQNGPN